LRLGTTQRPRYAWATLGVTHARAHLGTPGAWVVPLDPSGIGPASRPTMNGSSDRTQLFLGPPSRPKVPGS